MKIIAVSTRIPAAKKNGDQLLSFYRLVFLAKKNDIELICFGRDFEGNGDKLALEELGIVVHFIEWRLLVAIWFVFIALFDRSMPLQCALYTSYAFRRKFREVEERFEPENLYSVTVRPLFNIDKSKKPLVVDLIDSLGLNFFRRSASSNFIKKYLLAYEASRILNFERSVAQRAKQCFVVSHVDRAYIGLNGINVLPLGIDFNQFEKKHCFNQEPTIVFGGNMFYQPNIEAALWFVNNCWSDVKILVPEARLVIAGNNPVPEIKSLEIDPKITVTGRVESMAAVINACQVAIAPMQSGSGMQNKILEAMACAVPVVATSIGLGDIKAIHNQDILIGDTPEAIVELVVFLLKNKNNRIKIGEAGYQYVREWHQWEANNIKFCNKIGII